MSDLRTALERINEWCCYATEEDTSARLMALQQIGQTARAALAADSVAAEAKPVAWLVEDSLYGTAPGHLVVCDRHKANAFPVYASPTAAPAVSERKPLTRAQIEDIWLESPGLDGQGENAVTFARAIERAHGIKQEG